MNTKIWWTLIIVLLVVIVALSWMLIAPPEWLKKEGGTNTNGQNSEQISELARRVVVDAPKANAHVPKTFTMTGKAPGNWYFEASFPVDVVAADGTVLVQHYAEALTDWMTTDDVPYKAEIVITKNYSGPATIILHKDNPSGLPEHDDSVSLPVVID